MCSISQHQKVNLYFVCDRMGETSSGLDNQSLTLCFLIFIFLSSAVHAAVSANTFAIYGSGQVKELTELVPGILNQLGPDSLASLRKLAESYQSIQQGQQKPSNTGDADDNDDDDVPALVETFDVENEQKAKLEELN